MSENTNESNNAVRERIDQFIATVDRALADGSMADDERQNIAGDLRVQIEEMLAERAEKSGKPAGIDDVEAVLAELDPPESYSEASPPKEVEMAEQPAGQGAHSCGGGHWRRHGGFRGGGRRWFWGRQRVAMAVRQAIHSFSPFGHPAFVGMTERSRTAIALAKSEAQRMRHDFIGTEHLLLGLILEGTGVAAKVLGDLGLDREWAREEAEKLVAPGKSAVMRERLPLTPRLRQAIEEGRLAARNLGHDFLGTEHLLLGLLDVPGVGAQIIANRGLTPQQVRDEVQKRVASSAPPRPAPAPFTYWPASATREIVAGENRFKIIAGADDTGSTYAAVDALLGGPDGLGTRTHTREEISVYVLEGSIRLRVGERMVDLAKGDFSRIPRGTPHEIQPSGQSARLMLIATPAGIEKMIPALAETSEPEAKREVALRFGVMPG